MNPTKEFTETWTEVVRLYTLGQISSGRAAELADVSRVEFLLALDLYKVFPLEDELRHLEASNNKQHEATA